MSDIEKVPVERLRLKESVVKDSLERLDWPHLKKHLEDTDFTEVTLELFLGHLRRTNSLIMPYPNKKRELLRSSFMESISNYISGVLGQAATDLLHIELNLLNKIELGYRQILSNLDKCDISKLPPEIRAAAYIDRSVHQYSLLKSAIWASFNAKKEVNLPVGRLVINEGEPPISPDAVITGLIESLTITIIMEAHKNKWFDVDGYIVLPRLPNVTEDDQFKAGSTEVLALTWRGWRRTEERRRFLGGEFEEIAAHDLSKLGPIDAQHVTIYNPPKDELYDHVANNRLHIRLMQTFMEMLTESNMEAKATGIDVGGALIPQAFVSAEEAHAAVSLSEILSYDIAVDVDRPGGLRFVEWLRGYAVLQQLAKARNEGKSSVADLRFIISLAELISLLEKCGLDHITATHIINALSLKTSSRDLFDCPLIRMADGSLMVFAPALINANLARVILSAVSNLGEQLEQKGKAFEDDILSFLKKNELRAESFKFKRGNEEYEYDVVLDWGDYIFVFECKNHGLSNSRPSHAYYFNLGLRSYGKQVKRLTDALHKHPEVLKDKFGVDVTTKTVISCVLNALPFSLPGPADGVYYIDASVLKRFFQERYFHVKVPHWIDENVQILHRTAMHSFWSSDHPSPEDLLKQLEMPFQLKLELAHTELVPAFIALGDGGIVVTGEYASKDKTIESISDIVKVSSENVRKEITDVNRQVKKIKKRSGKGRQKVKRNK